MHNNQPSDPSTFSRRSSAATTRRAARSAVLMPLIVLSLFVSSAAAQTSRDRDLERFKRDGKELSRPAGRAPAVTAAPGADGRAAGWVIILGAFTGENRAADAEAAVRALGLAGVTGVTTANRGKATVLEYGSFLNADDPDAQTQLARLREITVEGEKKLAGAFLAPPENAPGATPEFDLRNALKGIRGKDKPIYTLQIGVYARGDDKSPTPKELDEFRRLAENAAASLRREGETAFYYHGPNRSMVTIGLFGPKDSDPLKPGQESMALRQLRERYPNNLLNGKGIRETATGADGKQRSSLQPSFLVAIPKN